MVAFGAELAVEGPGVVGCGEGLRFGPGERCGDGVGNGALVGEQVQRMVAIRARVPSMSGTAAATEPNIAREIIERQ